MLKSVVVTCFVARDARDLYEMLWRPEMFSRWASGLSGAALERDGQIWRAHGPDGPIRITFTDHNAFGVMDHWVEPGNGQVVHVPMRIVAHGDGSEVQLTLFRQPGMTDAQFARDEKCVRKDLAALKAFAEPS